MRRILITLPVLGALVLLASPAGAQVTDYIETFNDAWIPGGSVGPMPAGWIYPGYGPPSFTDAETGQTTEPHDGLDQSALYALPIDLIASECGGDQSYPCPSSGACWCGSGMYFYYTNTHGLDDMVSRPIDWDYPVTLTVDVQAYDPVPGGHWETILDVWWYDTTITTVEWGDNGHDNGVWTTAEAVVAAHQPGITEFGIVLIAEFDFPPGSTGEARALFDSLRVTYTPVPAAEICDNGVDDDLDGQTDCDDSDCLGDPACPCNPVVVFDIDLDNDVDQNDFGFFQKCITGPGPDNPLFDGLSPECKCMDVAGAGGDSDRAIDQQDYAAFEVCASGPEVMADPSCDGPPSESGE